MRRYPHPSLIAVAVRDEVFGLQRIADNEHLQLNGVTSTYGRQAHAQRPPTDEVSGTQQHPMKWDCSSLILQALLRGRVFPYTDGHSMSRTSHSMSNDFRVVVTF